MGEGRRAKGEGRRAKNSYEHGTRNLKPETLTWNQELGTLKL